MVHMLLMPKSTVLGLCFGRASVSAQNLEKFPELLNEMQVNSVALTLTYTQTFFSLLPDVECLSYMRG